MRAAQHLQVRITILTDIPDWVSPLLAKLEERDFSVACVDIRSYGWEPSGAPPDWGLVFNRISASPQDISVLTRGRDLLTALDLSGARLVNGLRCHLVGSSKALQSHLFRLAGVEGPRTLVSPAAGEGGIFKPNLGGYGQGLSTSEPVLSCDGMGVWQQRIEAADGRVHRVELLGEEILYQASVPLTEGQTNYCLARHQDYTIGQPDSTVSRACLSVARLAQLEVGSLEYLLDGDGHPRFIDLNPVSTYAPADRLGFDPYERLCDYLREALHQ